LGKHQATIARLADSEQLEVSEVVNQYLFHMNKKQKELIEDNFSDSINSVLQLCDKAKQVKPAQWSNISRKSMTRVANGTLTRAPSSS
jgi:PhoPQ-activated pathogenicity-related protein